MHATFPLSPLITFFFNFALEPIPSNSLFSIFVCRRYFLSVCNPIYNTLSATRLDLKKLVTFIQPISGLQICCYLSPRVTPAVIDIQALRACTNNSEFFMHNLSGSHEELPYIPSSPDPFNLENQTLHATALLSPLSTLSSSLFTNSPSPLVL